MWSVNLVMGWVWTAGLRGRHRVSIVDCTQAQPCCCVVLTLAQLEAACGQPC
jgi:hypothetical protein